MEAILTRTPLKGMFDWRDKQEIKNQIASLNFNYLTSAHVDGDRFNAMVNQRPANVASTAIKAVPTGTETADANR
jgi:hypothetical protein